MSDTVSLTDDLIYRIAPDGASVKAALELLRRSAFRAPRISPDGTRLQAGCQGSEPRPYAVQVDLSDPEWPRTGCNCASPKHPCKHALGLLFLAARSPDSFERAEVAAAVPASGTRANRRNRKKVVLLGAKARQEAAPEEKPPTDLRQALLQAVVTEPEEEGPRLIYADWLEEQTTPEDADRAEFIRAQVELAHAAEETERTRHLLRREQELWAAHKGEWLLHLPAHLRKREPRFHRGFLEELSLPPSTWAKHTARLFGQNPLFRFRFSGTVSRGEVGELVVLPDLARFRELSLAGCEVFTPITTLKILFGTPFLSGLVRLSMNGCGISTREAAVLAESPVLGRLVEIDLGQNRIGPGGAQALAASPVGSLRRLSLAGNPIGDVGGKALAESDHLESLERLDLSDVELSEKVKALLRDRFDERVVLS